MPIIPGGGCTARRISIHSMAVPLWGCVFGIVIFGQSGCESLHEAGLPGMTAFVDDSAERREEVEYRDRYLTTKDPQALRWLLEHRIHSGMSVADVNLVLGEDGERQYNDQWIKTKGGYYRTGDEVYHWGPDNEGRGLYLVFREEQLVNFDPQDYASAVAQGL